MVQDRPERNLHRFGDGANFVLHGGEKGQAGIDIGATELLKVKLPMGAALPVWCRASVPAATACGKLLQRR